MIRRARLLSVVGILLAGAIALISSTQSWLHVTLTDGAAEPLAIAGADAVPVLAPLSLAVLALGLALSIVGLVLRWIFGVLAAAIAAGVIGVSAAIVLGPPASAYAPTVTEQTGLGGSQAVADLVGAVSMTAWPVIALLAGVVVMAAALFTLATANRWRTTGRRYETAVASGATAAGPLDPIDSWDGLSRGVDPTEGSARSPRGPID